MVFTVVGFCTLVNGSYVVDMATQNADTLTGDGKSVYVMAWF
ncbi:MAG: hypothetical protein VXY83_01975 [Pseudomonadota bacterium]|nr:hypothetical protein [Pseudomonadota bacterium]MEC8467099.1 hypothetical protein [Pseudomonadota bacterium]